MPLIKTDSGCKVGWETYDNEAEAKARGEAVAAERARMLQQGYDFGYQWPGTVERRFTSQYGPDGRFDASLPRTPLDEWVVTVP
jgi:hypothetical protein